MTKTLFIIGHNYPEPTTTAAGGRMLQLIDLFLEQGFSIIFGTSATPSNFSMDLSIKGIQVVPIALNDTSFDEYITHLQPNLVLFDRYITEEQFGWRVAEQCPNAIRILDTEDLHFLRKARQESVKQGLGVNKANLYSETAKRELASILRSDLSLIISEVEMNLLQDTFNISKHILHYLPFLVSAPSEAEKKQFPSFDVRTHFMTIGNFKHAPNLDAVLYLKQSLWPLIRKSLPQAQLHIYGAYVPQQAEEMHSEIEGFLIKGWATSASEVMKKAKVCLAPLRFGAGLKGKLLDAMLYGTPSVTTSVGAEGMNGSLLFAGAVQDDAEKFAAEAIQLYTEEDRWETAQENGFRILENRFQKSNFSEAFQKNILDLQQNLSQHRQQNFIGQVLQHQSLQATKYLSRWIEEKNRLREES